MPASPFRGKPPLILDKTVDEVIKSGELMGVPSISVQQNLDDVVTVTFHWNHGDTVIYPARSNDMVRLGPTTNDKIYVPRPGDIGIVHISGAGGQVIRFLQSAAGCGFEDYEHALGCVSSDGDYVRVVEAEPSGAREAEFSYHGSTRWLVCPDQYRDAMVANLNRCADMKVPYSWLDYAAVGAHAKHIPLPGLKHYITTSKHMMCSQLVDWCAMQAGWHLFDDNRWPGYVPPCDLNALWHKHYELHNGTAY